MLGNEPMQPVVSPGDPCVHVLNTGITIRQAFVMAAMQAMSESYAHSTLTPYGWGDEVVTLADACLAREMETRKP